MLRFYDTMQISNFLHYTLPSVENFVLLHGVSFFMVDVLNIFKTTMEFRSTVKHTASHYFNYSPIFSDISNTFTKPSFVSFSSPFLHEFRWKPVPINLRFCMTLKET